MLRGSFVSCRGKTFVAQERTVEKFEWSYRLGSLSRNASEDAGRTDAHESLDRVL